MVTKDFFFVAVSLNLVYFKSRNIISFSVVCIVVVINMVAYVILPHNLAVDQMHSCAV